MKKGQLNIGLFGSSGKMGLAVEQSLADDVVSKNKTKLFPFLAIGRNPSSVFALSAKQLDQVEPDVLMDVDVWMDFSSAEGLKALLQATRKFKTPVVSGTTGFSTEQFASVKSEAKLRPIFWASNLSPGLWAFRQALKSFSILADFDFAISEVHHTKKKDKPSGTAKTLHQDLEKILNQKLPPPVSHRLGGVFGIHNVIAASADEIIEFQHQALNRNVFANGAIRAAQWLVRKPKGFYSMDDMYLNQVN